MIMNYGEFANTEEVEQAPRLFTTSETLEQYLERGGKVTKLAAGKSLWLYQVRSTGKVGAPKQSLNGTSDEV